MRLFDVYMFIDWSAISRPGPASPRRDAIWVGEMTSGFEPSARYHPTRRAAFADVKARLQRHVESGQRVLVGFDFPYGYPAGFASALSGRTVERPWLETWQQIRSSITDTPRNENNRFAVASQINSRVGRATPGPFWGAPESHVTSTLTARRIGHFQYPYRVNSTLYLAELRVCEQRLPGTQSSWKLFGNGSVGSQTLVGIPYVYDLRFDPALESCSSVWPFETGFISPAMETGPAVLHCEIWPGIVEDSIEENGRIRDENQVREMCTWANELDSAGKLAKRFEKPAFLDSDSLVTCVQEEGWILGTP
ncbi:MAG: hypothetical protein WD208_02880 [Dehalococcoidia bacterium]